mgnify:CR=1 FL=1
MKETYICSYSRTPIGAFQGGLSNISATELGSTSIKSTIDKLNIASNTIDEVIMGNVLSANLGQAPARQAAIGAGLSENTECMTINKVCGSGLKSIMLADQSIKTLNAESVIAGGMENMSLAPYYTTNLRKGKNFGNDILIDAIIHDGLFDPYNNSMMGNCAEKLCSENNYSRLQQDEYAIQSYERSNEAIKKGYFDNEICNVEVEMKKSIITLNKDEEPLKFNRGKILKLQPAFEKEGTITAANASSLSDGAASVFLASSEYIGKNNIKPIARIISHASYATTPIYFTKAPVYAIQKVLEKSNLDINKVDLFEINEAFSCVPMFAIDELKLDNKKVNVNGGAVSLGHPIGASGTRIFVTLLNALLERNLKYGIASLCIGGGEASAVLIETCNY